MQKLGTDRAFVQEQYTDADKLRIRIETHERYSRGDTERIVDDCVAALAPSPGLQVLDVGCGAGSCHPRIANAGAAVVGVDLMAGMLREARAADTALDPLPALVRADAQALPFPVMSFDRILCAGVLYHVQGCERALLEMRRVLRPGGRVIISTNGAYAMRRIYELHRNAARELGYEPLPITPGHFTMDDLPRRLSRLWSATPWRAPLCSRRQSRRCGSMRLTASTHCRTGLPMAVIGVACCRQCASASKKSSSVKARSLCRRAWAGSSACPRLSLHNL